MCKYILVRLQVKFSPGFLPCQVLPTPPPLEQQTQIYNWSSSCTALHHYWQTHETKSLLKHFPRYRLPFEMSQEGMHVQCFCIVGFLLYLKVIIPAPHEVSDQKTHCSMPYIARQAPICAHTHRITRLISCEDGYRPHTILLSCEDVT